MKKHGAVKFILIVAAIVLVTTVALSGFHIGIYKVHSVLTLLERGLDLRGGVEMVFQAEPLEQTQDMQQAVAGTMQKLSARLRSYGYEDAVISAQGADQIRIQVPLTDTGIATELIDMLSSSGELTFRLADGEVVLTGDHVEYAMAGRLTQNDQPAVTFELDEEGTQIFSQVTSEHVDETMSIYLDDEKIAEPVITAPITDGLISISQVGSMKDAEALAGMIASGELNVSLSLVSQKNIESELTQTQQLAAVLFLVAICVAACVWFVVRYRMAGVMAAVTLAVQALLVLFLMLTVSGTFLTMSGLLALCIQQAVVFAALEDFMRCLQDNCTRHAVPLQAVKQTEKQTCKRHVLYGVCMVVLGVIAQFAHTTSFVCVGRIIAFGGLAALLNGLAILPGFLRLALQMSGQDKKKLCGYKETSAKEHVNVPKKSIMRWIVPALCAVAGVILLIVRPNVAALQMHDSIVAICIVIAAVLCTYAACVLLKKRQHAEAVGTSICVAIDAVCALVLACGISARADADMLALVTGVCVIAVVIELAVWQGNLAAAFAAAAFLLTGGIGMALAGSVLLRAYAIAVLCAALLSLYDALFAARQLRARFTGMHMNAKKRT